MVPNEFECEFVVGCSIGVDGSSIADVSTSTTATVVSAFQLQLSGIHHDLEGSLHTLDGPVIYDVVLADGSPVRSPELSHLARACDILLEFLVYCDDSHLILPCRSHLFINGLLC